MVKLKPYKILDNEQVSIVLASTSTSKISLLESLNFLFEIDSPEVDETSFYATAPEELVLTLAFEKAKAVATRHTGKIIISTDTIGTIKSAMLEKPVNARQAEEMLRTLSGSTHQILSGLVIIDQISNKINQKIVRTNVEFRKLTNTNISNYIATNEWMGKAGAYAIQSLGSLLIRSVEGEYSNVMGMPVFSLIYLLNEMGYDII